MSVCEVGIVEAGKHTVVTNKGLSEALICWGVVKFVGRYKTLGVSYFLGSIGGLGCCWFGIRIPVAPKLTIPFLHFRVSQVLFVAFRGAGCRE